MSLRADPIGAKHLNFGWKGSLSGHHRNSQSTMFSWAFNMEGWPTHSPCVQGLRVCPSKLTRKGFLSEVGSISTALFKPKGHNRKSKKLGAMHTTPKRVLLDLQPSFRRDFSPNASNLQLSLRSEKGSLSQENLRNSRRAGLACKWSRPLAFRAQLLYLQKVGKGPSVVWAKYRVVK